MRIGPVVHADFWHAMPDGRVQCDHCPRFCRLRDGQHGLCFVRSRQGRSMVMNAYGRAVGFSLDPVEKHGLHHFLPGTAALSFGTAGCQLTCAFCENRDLTQSHRFDVLGTAAAPGAIAATARQLGCRSVAFAYNDPFVFQEYAVDVAWACHDQGIKAIAVTSGYACPGPRRDFFGGIDAVSVDLKGFNEEFYWRTCGAHLQPVLDTLVYVKHETGVWLEVSYPLIPDANDGERELDRMTRWIVTKLGPDVPLHMRAFHPGWKMRSSPHTSARALRQARLIAIRNGVRYAYTDDACDPEAQTTYCHGCGGRVVGRAGFVVSKWSLRFGACATCGTACPGAFEAAPGPWDGESLPARLCDSASLRQPKQKERPPQNAAAARSSF